MPRFPQLAASAGSIPGSVYSALAGRARQAGEVFPFHVGDTWMEPPAGCRMEDLRTAEHPGLHRYTRPQGLPELCRAVAERAERRGVATSPQQVLITTGATGGLGAAAGALLDPGDEVLILAPYWPLISGIVTSFHGLPVPVPCFGTVDSPAEAVAAVEARRTPRTVALYLNTPNNPTGRVLPRAWLEALAAWAARHHLWLLADEVYEAYQYAGEHLPCRALAPERTLAAHSFSKTYGMTGNRCGYVIAPEDAILALRRVGTHTFYSAPTASQVAALRALGETGDAWVAAARAAYRRLGEETAERLGVPPPEGGTFLFLDVADRLDARGLPGLLEDCADAGLLLAPGPSFGPYPGHLRLCFTAAEPAVTRRGVERLAEILGRSN